MYRRLFIILWAIGLLACKNDAQVEPIPAAQTKPALDQTGRYPVTTTTLSQGYGAPPPLISPKPQIEVQGPMVIKAITYVDKDKRPLNNLSFRTSDTAAEYLFGLTICISQGAPTDPERNVGIALLEVPTSGLTFGAESNFHSDQIGCLGWSAGVTRTNPGTYEFIVVIRDKTICKSIYGSDTQCGMSDVRYGLLDLRFDTSRKLSITISN